ncbi:hypothetical protein J7J90_02995 [Candidatus Micrarchaeota archaeon]|nr:hypothetical protein [Candidatus Micrarchaeota archaeon]
MNMKAQISLELLIVFAVFLTVIIFSLSMLNTMNKNNTMLYNTMKVRMTAEDIGDAAENVCILGNGNIRKVYVPFKVNVSYNGSHIMIGRQDREYFKYLPCQLENSPMTDVEGIILIKNVNGKINIEKS